MRISSCRWSCNATNIINEFGRKLARRFPPHVLRSIALFKYNVTNLKVIIA